jgi:hypothetical protein
VLANGTDPEAVRAMAARVARTAGVERTETFFPLPGAPAGVLAPASWAPETLDPAGATARARAPDDPAAGVPGLIRYEFRAGGSETGLEAFLAGLDEVARSRGAAKVRTSGVETRAGGRPVIAYQQAVDERVLLTGAVIRYPAGALQVTYFDRPDRARTRKAMFDQLVDAMARREIAPSKKAAGKAGKAEKAPSP